MIRTGVSDGDAAAVGDRHADEPAQPVGAAQEPDRPAGQPAGTGLAVGGEELAIAQNGLDAGPLVASGEARPQVGAGARGWWGCHATIGGGRPVCRGHQRRSAACAIGR